MVNETIETTGRAERRSIEDLRRGLMKHQETRRCGQCHTVRELADIFIVTTWRPSGWGAQYVCRDCLPTSTAPGGVLRGK